MHCRTTWRGFCYMLRGDANNVIVHLIVAARRIPGTRRWHASCFRYTAGSGVVSGRDPEYTAEGEVSTKTVEERLTVVEHKVAENARGIDGLREAIVELGDRMDRRFEAIDRRFEAIDRRFEALELRFDQRLESMEQRFDRRFVTMDQNMSRQFRWIVGIQLTTLIAMVGAIATLAAAALGR